MRKLLSLLAISALLGSTSINTVACRSKKPVNIKKVDITNKSFNDISYNSNVDIYNSIRKQMGEWASPRVSNDVIKNDQSIMISIFQKNSQSNIDDRVDEYASLAVDASKHSYYVVISVSADDIYFKQMEPTEYALTLQFNKIDITAKTFDIISYNSNQDIYQNIRTQIASWTQIAISASDIKNDEDINISVYEKVPASDEDIKVDENALSAVNPAYQYYVILSVSADDQYFKEMQTTEYALTLQFNKIDISSKHTFTSDLGRVNSDVYNSVRDQIADWINVEGVDATTIKNDEDAKKITITIIAPDGTTPISDNDEQLPKSGDYTVTIKVTDDQYLVNNTGFTTTISIKVASTSPYKFEIKANDSDSTMMQLYDTTNGEEAFLTSDSSSYAMGIKNNTDAFSNGFFRYDAINADLYFISNDKLKEYKSEGLYNKNRIGFKTEDEATKYLNITLTANGYIEIYQISAQKYLTINGNDSTLYTLSSLS